MYLRSHKQKILNRGISAQEPRFASKLKLASPQTLQTSIKSLTTIKSTPDLPTAALTKSRNPRSKSTVNQFSNLKASSDEILPTEFIAPTSISNSGACDEISSNLPKTPTADQNFENPLAGGFNRPGPDSSHRTADNEYNGGDDPPVCAPSSAPLTDSSTHAPPYVQFLTPDDNQDDPPPLNQEQYMDEQDNPDDNQDDPPPPNQEQHMDDQPGQPPPLDPPPDPPDPTAGPPAPALLEALPVPFGTDMIAVPPVTRRIGEKAVAAVNTFAAAVLASFHHAAETGDDELECTMAEIYQSIPSIVSGGPNKVNSSRIIEDCERLTSLVGLHQCADVKTHLDKIAADLISAARDRIAKPRTHQRSTPSVEKLAYLIHHNAKAKAVQLLRSEVELLGLAPMDAVTALKIVNLTPNRPPAPFQEKIGPLYPSVPYPVALKHSIRLVLKHAPNEVSPGLSGWTYELYRQLFALPKGAGNDDINPHLDQVVTLINGMMSNKFSASRRIWVRQRCLGIYKDTTKGPIRPISSSEPLLSLAMQIANAYDKTTTEYLQPLQLGVGTANGCEIVAHTLQIAAELIPTLKYAPPINTPENINASAPEFVWQTQSEEEFNGHPNIPDAYEFGIQTTDTTNAFNNLNLDAAWEQVCIHLSCARGVFHFAYGQSNSMYFPNGAYVGERTTGVRQGCVLGSKVYALTTHPVLLALQTEFPLLLIRAIADDMYMIGDTRQFPAARQQMRTQMVPLDLTMNEIKSLVLDRHWYTNGTGGFKCLGAAIGSPGFRKNFVFESLEQQYKLLERISRLPTSVGLPLVQKCINIVPQYMARTNPTCDIVDSLKFFDHKVDKAIAALVVRSGYELSTEARIIRSLPCIKGGMGIPRLAVIGLAAWTSSVLRAVQHIGETAPSLVERVCYTKSRPLQKWWTALNFLAREHVSEHHHYENDLLPRTFRDGFQNVVKLPTQKTLTNYLVNEAVAELENLTTNSKAKWYSYLAYKYKGSYTSIMRGAIAGQVEPQDGIFYPTDSHLAQALQRRLLIRLPCEYCHALPTQPFGNCCALRQNHIDPRFNGALIMLLRLLRIYFGELNVIGATTNDGTNFSYVIKHQAAGVSTYLDLIPYDPKFAPFQLGGVAGKHYTENWESAIRNNKQHLVPQGSHYRVVAVESSGKITRLVKFLKDFTQPAEPGAPPHPTLNRTVPRTYREQLLNSISWQLQCMG